jgi:hypothetical protein
MPTDPTQTAYLAALDQATIPTRRLLALVGIDPTDPAQLTTVSRTVQAVTLLLEEPFARDHPQTCLRGLQESVDAIRGAPREAPMAEQTDEEEVPDGQC